MLVRTSCYSYEENAILVLILLSAIFFTLLHPLLIQAKKLNRLFFYLNITTFWSSNFEFNFSSPTVFSNFLLTIVARFLIYYSIIFVHLFYICIDAYSTLYILQNFHFRSIVGIKNTRIARLIFVRLLFIKARAFFGIYAREPSVLDYRQN